MTNENFEKELKEMLISLLEPVSANSHSLGDTSIKLLFETRLEELGITQNQVENIIGVERKSLVGILDRTAKRVDVVNLLKLAQFLGLTPDQLLKIYVNELPSDTIGEIEQSKRKSFIASNFDVIHLKKEKFFSSKSDFNQIEDRITKFFGFESIFEYEQYSVFPAFSRTRKNSNNLMLDFWIKSAYLHFERINNPNPYNRNNLVDLIPKIRHCTMNVEQGLYTVIRALYNVGVTVIYQPHLTTVQARGATFIVNDKPCIVITDLGKRYPTLWFALLHEIHHTLFDLEEIATRVFHITGEPDLFLMEEKANEFAGEYLFNREKRQYIKPFLDNEHLVREFAKECSVHPSIIYNYAMYDDAERGKRNAWVNKHQHLYPNVNNALTLINSNPWKKETIEESINEMKEKVFNF